MTDKKKYGVTNLLNGNKKNGVREILPSMHTIHRPGGGMLKTSLLKKFHRILRHMLIHLINLSHLGLL